ncbi:hypothetical protein HMPREF0298_1402 [Corynebacterium lipophiloflavum DSM 44291]|uniref:Uncharacterized protein n=1 Tax=Corynebacterium lipophiloflavum (strain ATCC 700352 / DSM 44291 / CCUG 37336 / JCM 10383 / DMMZ 1944) TaxID=525263 RepID=C0XSI2_CORLD|nr:hypothetical protein HMPREF0298_1402 [Corynebacterium lipophiloflavum DSM 44291]
MYKQPFGNRAARNSRSLNSVVDGIDLSVWGMMRHLVVNESIEN